MHSNGVREGLALAGPTSQLTLAERDTRWMDEANCQGYAEIVNFYPEPASGPYSQRYDREVAEAKTFCDTCPVKAECFNDAVSRGERFGIWGGVDFYISRHDLPGGRSHKEAS